MPKIYNVAVCVILIIVFLKISLISTVKELINRYNLKKNGKKAEGEIIFLNSSIDSGIIKTYFPTVQFTNIKGEKVSFFLKEFDFRKPVLGSKVEVFYNELNPTNAIVNSKRNNELFYLKLIINISVIFFLISNLLYNIMKE